MLFHASSRMVNAMQNTCSQESRSPGKAGRGYGHGPCGPGHRGAVLHQVRFNPRHEGTSAAPQQHLNSTSSQNWKPKRERLLANTNGIGTSIVSQCEPLHRLPGLSLRLPISVFHPRPDLSSSIFDKAPNHVQVHRTVARYSGASNKIKWLYAVLTWI